MTKQQQAPAEDIPPNGFYTPNIYVDRLLTYLTPEEVVVLLYATRRIFGFHKSQDTISLSQFCTGTVSKKTGEHHDYGTGLNLTTVRKALASLEKFGVIVKVSENDPYKNEGALYALSYSSSKFDWEGLKQRQQEWADQNANRTAKARQARKESGGSIVAQQGGVLSDRSDLSHNMGGDLSHNMGGDLSDSNTIYSGNTGKHRDPSIHPCADDSDDRNERKGKDGWMDEQTRIWKEIRTTEQGEFFYKIGCEVASAVRDLIHLPLSDIQDAWERAKVSNARDPRSILILNLRTRAKLAAEMPPAAPPEPDYDPAADDRRPDWCPLEDWSYMSDAIRDMLKGAQVVDGEIVAVHKDWTDKLKLKRGYFPFLYPEEVLV